MFNVNGISKLSFYLIFPGFFYYGWLVASGLLMPLPLGYYGLVVPLVLFMFLVSSVLYGDNSIVSCGYLGLVFIVLQMYMIIASFVNYLFCVGGDYSSSLFLWVASGCLLNIVLYYTGRYLSFDKSNLYFFVLVGFFAIIFLNLGDDYIFYLKRNADADVQDNIATYQGFGRSLMVFGLFAVVFSGKYLSFVCFVLSLLMLFLNGARTELFLFVVGVSSYLFFLLGAVRGVVVSLGSFVVIVCLGYFYYIINPESRIFEFFTSNQSSSGSARFDMLLFSVSSVFSSVQSIILGDFGSYVEFGGIGAYPHNLFSAWHNFGVVVFLLYVSLILYLWWLLLFIIKSKSPLLGFGVAILTITTVAYVISKDNSYMLFGLLVGIATNKKLIQQNEFLTSDKNY